MLVYLLCCCYRLVNTILQEELKTIHAFSQKTLTPEQWRQQQAQAGRLVYRKRNLNRIISLKNSASVNFVNFKISNDFHLQFVIKVPGKVILTGEHAVVYGKLALAASIDLSTRIDLKLEPSAQDRLNIHFNDFNFNFQVPLEDLSQESVVSMENLKIILKNHLLEQNPAVERSILAICYLFCNLTASPIDGVSFDVKLSVKSDIPIGAGLGSSAAFSVASSAAVHVIRHFKSGGGEFCADCDAINRWAFELEKMFHATPSGVDNSVCTRGGIVRFQSGRYDIILFWLFF